MAETGYIVIFITAGSAGEARQLARRLLEQKQAACVNIVPGVESSFWWQGKIDTVQECLLVVKTRASRLPEITRLVREAHSYQMPEIIALPVVGGSQDYLDWIGKEVA